MNIRIETEEATVAHAPPIDRKCAAVILALAFLQGFNFRFQLGPDGISYLDLGDFWLNGDIANGVNGYWNPVLPICLAFASRIVGHPLAEPFVAHMFNFIVVGLNLFLFGRLLGRIREFGATQGENPNGASDNLFTALAYLLFLWCHLDLIHLKNISPDFLVTTSVVACAICLIRLLLSHNPSWSAAGLGTALGFGYLVKAILFVVAPFFILAALFCAPCLSKGLKHAILATLVFGIISAPYVWLLSKQQGHLTYSEAGKLAYAWMVNETRPWFHWQGDEPGTGTPEHPTRRLLKNPEVFEFGDRPGTYPPWFDPSYWHKGLQVKINSENQLKAISANLQLYFSVF